MRLPQTDNNNIRQLPARIDRRTDQLQAAADDAALARDERNEAIADGVTFDALPISTTACAVIDAALARGRIEDVYAVWNILITARRAEISRRIAAADVAESRPLAMTYCSQCGSALGPGTDGVSHCSDHRAPALHLLREA
ncbi:hypothetical protein [Burkholderia sp. Ac-20344]|uniref:hypothetical protein n=1 Tax=Burkholderia sp. Ac-20344 TaxID=2703890 RepID=UPI00197BC2C9|nr:hypothetical protein [Burkholderia sp. Ac-20344]MBN3832927.1 hypothetical protein [Burkholderia sp. Ac-20344]